MSENPFEHDYGTKKIFESLSDIAGKHITIMGLGLNGGGEAVATFLAKHGAILTITDMKTAAELAPTIEKISKDPSIDTSKITYILGHHDITDFENADCVIKNPGIKYDGNKFLAVAKHIETDLSLFLQFCPATIIAVTGSKGKSSTASAIYYGLCKAGFDAKLGGNITVSPLSFIDTCTEKTPVVLELSSWQLSDLRGRHLLKPRIAVLTTIVADHQNWYHAMEPYIADKKLIYADQSGDDVLFCADRNNWGNEFASEAPAHVVRYPIKPDEEWLNDICVPGEHQKQNVYNAYLVLCEMGVKEENAIKIMQSYPGIEHRLEYFYTWNKIKFYNDTTATVPEAAVAAIKAFKEPVHFMGGGTDKGLELDVLADALTESIETQRVRSIRLLEGTGTKKLIKLLKKRKVDYLGPFDSLESMLNDFKKTIIAEFSISLERPANSKSDTHTNLVVVFSPGATSFGMFANEFDRGSKFKEAVKEIFR
ncbi:MAG: UDP-N-acetylmuramoylalanine--D-glutamate ligase [Treponema sp. CETP13]|nr:MAG: UDP-N-acetylmuramoylalanine--D-glutamate ligase [Treponema sp. CETP13]